MVNIQVFQLSLEELSTIIREAVATELNLVNSKAPTPKDDSDKIMTREEVCKLLKVSTTTLFHWNNDKVLVNYKIGRRVYYMKADVMAKLTNLKIVA